MLVFTVTGFDNVRAPPHYHESVRITEKNISKLQSYCRQHRVHGVLHKEFGRVLWKC